MSGSRCTPSTIAWKDDRGRTSAGADDAGVAVRQRAHRVEDVGHRADASVEGCVSLGRRGIRVAERDDDAAPVEEIDELERAGKLRRERHEAYRACGEQTLEQRRVGVAAGGEPVRTEPGRGRERPFQVDAEDPRAGGVLGNGRDRGGEVGLLRGDQRGQIRRDAGLEERFAGGREPVGVRAQEVDPGEAVDLQVDEAGHRDPAADAVEADGLDPAAVDRDVARNEPTVDERGLDAEPHASSALRTTPSASVSRSRAVAASASASSITIATFASPPDASRRPRPPARSLRWRARRCGGRGPGASRSSRRRRP